MTVVVYFVLAAILLRTFPLNRTTSREGRNESASRNQI